MTPTPQIIIDVRTEKDVLGNLQVKLDYGFANPQAIIDQRARGRFLGPLKHQGKKSLNIVFSSYITFNKDITIAGGISDGQLLQRASDAYTEMRQGIDIYKLPKYHQPRMMTALAVNNELYFSSSARGPPFTYASENLIRADLEECQRSVAGSSPQHKFQGSCGEVFAAHQFLKAHGPDDRLKRYQGNLIVTVGQGKKGEIEIRPPCNPKFPVSRAHKPNSRVGFKKLQLEKIFSKNNDPFKSTAKVEIN